MMRIPGNCSRASMHSSVSTWARSAPISARSPVRSPATVSRRAPENGFDVRRAFAGSEGTWGIVLAAKMRLVPEPAHTAAVVLGYPDMVAAAHDAPRARDFPVAACEGLDSRMLDRVIAAKGGNAVPALPEGAGWLVVELTGDDAEILAEEARRLIDESRALDSAVVDAETAAAVWAIRADGAGLVSRTPDGRDAHAGWEDSAVPVEHLGDYLRDLMDLLDEHGLWGSRTGTSVTDACTCASTSPSRIPTARQCLCGDSSSRRPSSSPATAGRSRESTATVAHAPSAAALYPPEVIDLNRAVKELFDPRHLLGPGVIVDPDPLDASIRLTERPGAIGARSARNGVSGRIRRVRLSRPPVHGGRQMPRGFRGERWDHVPVVPGHEGRAALDEGSRPGAPGDGLR